MNKMKAIIKAEPSSGAMLVNHDMPKMTSHQVLIQVKATSICGTDVHIYNWDDWAASRISVPMIFGHEFSGEVIDIGPQVEHIRVGDYVSAETHIPCKGCYQCRTGRMHICQHGKILGVDRHGSFAEYIAIPEICCIKNSKDLPWHLASIQEPLGNAFHCVSESQVSGKSVVIFGDGPIGIMATGLSRLYGASKIIACGMQPARLKMMAHYDPDEIINVNDVDVREYIMSLTHGHGVDIVLEMSGAESAIHDGLAVLKRGGTFSAFGIPSQPITMDLAEELIFKGIRFMAINGRKMFATWHEMADVLASGRFKVDQLITHTFPLAQMDDAMALLNQDEIQAGKIILIP